MAYSQTTAHPNRTTCPCHNQEKDVLAWGAPMVSGSNSWVAGLILAALVTGCSPDKPVEPSTSRSESATSGLPASGLPASGLPAYGSTVYRIPAQKSVYFGSESRRYFIELKENGRYRSLSGILDWSERDRGSWRQLGSGTIEFRSEHRLQPFSADSLYADPRSDDQLPGLRRFHQLLRDWRDHAAPDDSFSPATLRGLLRAEHYPEHRSPWAGLYPGQEPLDRAAVAAAVEGLGHYLEGSEKSRFVATPYHYRSTVFLSEEEETTYENDPQDIETILDSPGSWRTGSILRLVGQGEFEKASRLVQTPTPTPAQGGAAAEWRELMANATPAASAAGYPLTAGKVYVFSCPSDHGETVHLQQDGKTLATTALSPDGDGDGFGLEALRVSNLKGIKIRDLMTQKVGVVMFSL